MTIIEAATVRTDSGIISGHDSAVSDMLLATGPTNSTLATRKVEALLNINIKY